MTLVFPHNRSFVTLKPVAVAGGADPGQKKHTEPGPATPTTVPAMPTPPAGLPAGVGPQSSSGPSVPAIPPMPAMPMMPPMMAEKIELQSTGKKEKILGYACEQYEIKQRGETMEIWATDKLFPFQPYLRNQPSRFGPRMIEEQWQTCSLRKNYFHCAPACASMKAGTGLAKRRTSTSK